ncbi:MAG: class I SAM-dependent methyltransferase [Phycisphaerae bacterium]|nr:class I SAM-dependent methyltransferase [Phycisphaerae bacterium]
MKPPAPLGWLLRFFVSHDQARAMGVKSLKDERMEAVLSHVTGRLLDVGCGEGNELVAAYGGGGLGVDVYPWEKTDVLCDTRNMPLPDASFDTVTMVAVLNHIPQREVVLTECARVLRPGGKIVITMLSPLIGTIRHKMARWDRDQHEREMADGEAYGMTRAHVEELLGRTGFARVAHRRFLLGLNQLFVGTKA